MDTSLLTTLVFIIATLYASAGFGGASGYLTAMSFFDIPVNVMASTALVLNTLVSSISLINYKRAGHLKQSLLVPFLVTSVPAAFIGGYMKISEQAYTTLLYVMLTYLAVRMVFFRTQTESETWISHRLPLRAALITGAVIGLLSGMLGIGGGIFLSPLILLMQWGTSKQAAASAGGFIAINSVSGLIGRVASGTLAFGHFGWWLLPAGLLGALIGSQLGALKFSNTGVRRTLGIILTIAVSTYWFNSLFAL
ncbi:MAG TPA: sulfite exporter TauE/SafE family protein [Anaerolineales bacterium]|nr:sulfite exporter TauE/SafE family protein [Anaerolineales bacterium]